MDKIAFSIAETAQTLGLGRTKIYELINEGRLTTFKIGRRTLIRAQSIYALAGGCGEAGP